MAHFARSQRLCMLLLDAGTLDVSATRTSGRQLTGASLQEIGHQFGGRHHTTVLHSIRKIDAMRRSDGALDYAIRRLIAKIAQQLACISCPGNLWSGFGGKRLKPTTEVTRTRT